MDDVSDVGNEDDPRQLPLVIVTSSIARSPVKEGPTIPLNVTCGIININIYLTIILRGRAGYEMIDNQRGA